jgi:hypothetical protein
VNDQMCARWRPEWRTSNCAFPTIWPHAPTSGSATMAAGPGRSATSSPAPAPPRPMAPPPLQAGRPTGGTNRPRLDPIGRSRTGRRGSESWPASQRIGMRAGQGTPASETCRLSGGGKGGFWRGFGPERSVRLWFGGCTCAGAAAIARCNRSGSPRQGGGVRQIHADIGQPATRFWQGS